MLIGHKRLGSKAPLLTALILLLTGLALGWADEPVLDTEKPANAQASPFSNNEEPVDTVQVPPAPEKVVPTSRLDGREVIPGLPPKLDDEEKVAEPQPPKEKHPVVQAVIPLVPETPFPEDWLQPPAPADTPAKALQPFFPVSQSNPAPVKSTPKTVVSTTPISPAPTKSDVKPDKVELKTKPIPTNPTPQAGKTASSKQKPVVHFPALPAAAKTVRQAGAKTNPQATGRAPVYPKGYTPYVAPIATQQRQWNTQAIAAYNRGNHYGRQNKLAQAIAEYKQAISLAPTLADAYVGLSTTHIHQNDWESVLNEARQALSFKTGFLDPANIIQAKVNLTLAYCVVDDYKAARKYYQQLQNTGYASLPQLGQYLEKQCKP